jgi:hypothetical protein
MSNRLSETPVTAPHAEPQAPSTQPAPAAQPSLARGSVAHIPSPNQFADGTLPSPKVSAEGTSPDAKPYVAPAPAAPRVPADLAAKASALGEVWSTDYVRELRGQQRAIAGGWPGTLREARRRILAAMPRDLDPLHLEELAKIMNLAARRGWESISEPDLEP